MSGSGYLCRRRALRLTTDAAVEQEREDCIDLIRRKIAAVQTAVARHQLPEADGAHVALILDETANAIDAGLHLRDGR